MKTLNKKYLLILSVVLIVTISMLLISGCNPKGADASETDQGIITASGEIDGYQYNIIDHKKAELTGYIGNDSALTIPSYFEEKPLYSVSGFKNNSSITIVVIPDGVMEIGSEAFSNCSNLSAITIPSSVSVIFHNAFSSCSSLVSIDLPENLEEIGFSAFENCTSLSSISLPQKVKKVDTSAFKNCSSLAEIDMASAIEEFKMDVFKNTLWLNNQTDEFVVKGGILLAFNISSEKNIIIPQGVRIVAAELADNETIETLAFPESLSDYGNLISAPNLKSITVDSNNNYFNSQEGVLFNKDKTLLIKYPSKKAGDTYTIPQGVITQMLGSIQNEFIISLVYPQSFALDAESIVAFNPELLSSNPDFWDAEVKHSIINSFNLCENIETLKFKAEYNEKVDNWITNDITVNNELTLIWDY